MPDPGAALGRIERAAVISAATLVATSAIGAVAPVGGGAVHAVLSVVCFVVGTGALLWAYAVGLARSRRERIDLPGLFWLAGEVAPAPARRRLRAALGVEVAAVVAAASIRPYTAVAFGILAPMLGLGLMAAWGARHGVFAERSATQVSRLPGGDGGECPDG